MFKEKKYTVIKSAISKELSDFVYSYFLLKRKVARTYFDLKLYHLLLNTLVYGMISKYQKPILIMEILRWKLC